jgi:pyruvate/2-oxoglutarate dehydrogenase complex dihydrolipoamide acyltransferase (E2) component
MKVDVKMPNLGYDMEEGKIASWLKGVGDAVERGAQGSTVAVGDVIAYLESDA